jgi:hypothetical protein
MLVLWLEKSLGERHPITAHPQRLLNVRAYSYRRTGRLGGTLRTLF